MTTVIFVTSATSEVMTPFTSMLIGFIIGVLLTLGDRLQYLTPLLFPWRSAANVSGGAVGIGLPGAPAAPWVV
jgi:hypothetical protein